MLVGIQNNSNVSIGAIRLSGSNTPFGFDGDGPCNYLNYTSEEGDSADCFNNEVPSSSQNSSTDPFDYEGPNNTFTGISPDLSTGTVHFVTPIPPSESTWFALDYSPTAVVSVGETQQAGDGRDKYVHLARSRARRMNAVRSGTWTEQTPTPPTPAVDDSCSRPSLGSLAPLLDGPSHTRARRATGRHQHLGPFDINVPPVDAFFGNGQFGDVTPTAAAYGPSPLLFTAFPSEPPEPEPEPKLSGLLAVHRLQ